MLLAQATPEVSSSAWAFAGGTIAGTTGVRLGSWLRLTKSP